MVYGVHHGNYAVSGAARQPTCTSEAREWLRSQLRHRMHLRLHIYIYDGGSALPFRNVVITSEDRDDDEYSTVRPAKVKVAEGTWPEIWETFIAHVRMQETA